MGSSSTKAVGGVPVSQTAQNYTSFLGNALNSGSTAQSAIQSLLQGSGSANNTNLNNYISSLSQYQPGQVSTPQSNLNLSQGMGSSYQQPDLSSYLSQLSQNITAPTSGSTAGNFQSPDITSLLAQLQNSVQAPNSNVNLNQINPLTNQLSQPVSAIGSNVNTTTQSTIDPSLQSALSSIINTQQGNDVNQLHERFTANGAGAGVGTPGAYAEAVYRAQAAPQLANAIGQLGLQSRGMNQTDVGNALNQASVNQAGQLQAAGINSSNLSSVLQSILGQQGQQLNQSQGNASNQLAASGLNSNNLATALQGLLGQGSLNSSNQLGNRGIDVTQNQNNASNQLATNSLNSNNIGTILQSLLNQGSIGSQNQVSNRGLDINQLAQMLSQNQGNASNQLQADSLNNQSQQFGQSNLLNIAQLLSGNQNANTQGQLGVLAQLFGGLNQANQMGTTQAQTVQQPSMFSNIMSGLSGITGLGSSLLGTGGLSSLFGGGGNNFPATMPNPFPNGYPIG